MKKVLFVFLIAISMVLSSCTPEGQLEIMVAGLSTECPMTIDETITCTDIFTEGKNIVYLCVVEEQEVGFNLSKIVNSQTKHLVKEDMLRNYRLQTITNKDFATFIQLCKEAKYNIIFRCIGSSTGDKYDITIYSHEL